MFDSSSQEIFIVVYLIKKLRLWVHDNPIPYPLGRVNKEAEIKLTKQCKINFVTRVDFIDVELDVAPLDVYGIVFGSSYMYM